MYQLYEKRTEKKDKPPASEKEDENKIPSEKNSEQQPQTAVDSKPIPPEKEPESEAVGKAQSDDSSEESDS